MEKGVKYVIKSKADTKAIKDTEKAVKDLGREHEKTNKKIKETTQAVKDTDDAMKKGASSSRNFAMSLGKQVFGALVSFAVVTKAVNALKTIFAPALSGVTTSADEAGQALGRFLAAKSNLEGAEGFFKTIASSLNSFAEANEKVVISLRNTRKELSDPEIKAYLAGEASIFGNLNQAQKSADQRTLQAFDLKTQEMIQTASASGKNPKEVSDIETARAKQRAGLTQSMNQRDISSTGDFFNQFDLTKMSAAINEGTKKETEIDSINKQLSTLASEMLTLEKQLSSGLPGGPNLDLRKQMTAAQIVDMRNQIESLKGQKKTALGQLEGFRQQSMGMSSQSQLSQFSAGLDSAKTGIAKSVMGDVNMRTAEADTMISQAESGGMVAIAQTAKEEEKRIEQERIKSEREITEIRKQQKVLLEKSFSIESQTYQALDNRVRELESRQRNQRNTGSQ